MGSLTKVLVLKHLPLSSAGADTFNNGGGAAALLWSSGAIAIGFDEVMYLRLDL
jgi:hypothetical protein